MSLFAIREGYRVVTSENGGRVVHVRTGDALELTPAEVQILARATAGGIDPNDPELKPVVRKLRGLGLLVPVVDPRMTPVPLPAEADGPAPRLPTVAASDIVPTLRRDLSIVPKEGSSLFAITNPTTGKTSTLYDFEVSLARMLDGRHDFAHVVDAGKRIGIPVNLESLSQFVRQLERDGLLGAADPSAKTAPPRDAGRPRQEWDEATRAMFQSGIRLTREGRYLEAAQHFEELLSRDPNNQEARDRLAEVTQRLESGDAQVVRSALTAAVPLPAPEVPEALPEDFSSEEPNPWVSATGDLFGDGSLDVPAPPEAKAEDVVAAEPSPFVEWEEEEVEPDLNPEATRVIAVDQLRELASSPDSDGPPPAEETKVFQLDKLQALAEQTGTPTEQTELADLAEMRWDDVAPVPLPAPDPKVLKAAEDAPGFLDLDAEPELVTDPGIDEQKAAEEGSSLAASGVTTETAATPVVVAPEPAPFPEVTAQEPAAEAKPAEPAPEPEKKPAPAAMLGDGPSQERTLTEFPPEAAPAAELEQEVTPVPQVAAKVAPPMEKASPAPVTKKSARMVRLDLAAFGIAAALAGGFFAGRSMAPVPEVQVTTAAPAPAPTAVAVAEPAPKPAEEKPAPVAAAEPKPEAQANAEPAPTAAAADEKPADAKPSEEKAAEAKPAEAKADEKPAEAKVDEKPAEPVQVAAKADEKPEVKPAVAVVPAKASEAAANALDVKIGRKGRVTMGEVKAAADGTVSWKATELQPVKKGETLGTLTGADGTAQPLTAPKAGLFIPKLSGTSAKSGDLLAAVVYNEAFLQAVVPNAHAEASWTCEIVDEASGQKAPCKIVTATARGQDTLLTGTTEPMWFDTAAGAKLRLTPP